MDTNMWNSSSWSQPKFSLVPLSTWIPFWTQRLSRSCPWEPSVLCPMIEEGLWNHQWENEYSVSLWCPPMQTWFPCKSLFRVPFSTFHSLPTSSQACKEITESLKSVSPSTSFYPCHPCYPCYPEYAAKHFFHATFFSSSFCLYCIQSWTHEEYESFFIHFLPKYFPDWKTKCYPLESCPFQEKYALQRLFLSWVMSQLQLPPVHLSNPWNRFSFAYILETK